jgi:hypothetical protein
MKARYAAALFLAVTALAPAVHADTTTAESLFQDGLNAMKKNDFVVACDAFDKSNKTDPSPGTQINLAICYEKQKKWASAWTWYRAAAGLAHLREQATREASATESAKRIEPNIHHVIISVKNAPSDMVVKRDGAEIAVTLGGRDAPVAIDPGEHTIEIKGTGRKPFTKTITVADNAQTDTIDITLEEAPADQALDTSGPGTRTTVIRTESDGSTQRTVGIIVGGAGLLSGVASIGLFILANNEQSDRDKFRKDFDNENLGTPERTAAGKAVNSHNDAAQNDQLIGLILAGGAAVMVGLGAVLFFTAPKPKEKTAHTKILPTPIAGPTFQGLGVVGTF